MFPHQTLYVCLSQTSIPFLRNPERVVEFVVKRSVERQWSPGVISLDWSSGPSSICSALNMLDRDGHTRMTVLQSKRENKKTFDYTVTHHL